MNFNLKPQTKANQRTNATAPRGQNFTFRFRRFMSKSKDENGVETEKEESKFFIADKAWDSMGLETQGIKSFFDREDDNSPVRNVLFLVVPNEEALLLKNTSKNEGVTKTGVAKTKGRNFKSTELEGALVEAGVLEAGKLGENQFMKFAPIEIGGVTYLHIVKEEKTAEEKAAFDAPAIANEAANTSSDANVEEEEAI